MQSELLARLDDNTSRLRPDVRSDFDIRPAAMVATCILLTGSLVALVAGGTTSRSMLLSIALAACAVVTWPLALRGARIVSTWTGVVATIYLTVGIRTAYIVADHPDPATIESLFTLSVPLSEMLTPGTWTVGFLLLTSVGYGLARMSGSGRSPWRPRLLEPTRHQANVLVGVFAVLGFIGLAQFVDNSGGLAIISAKRNFIDFARIGVDPSFQSYGHWRFLHRCSAIALMLYLVTNARQGLRPTQWAIVGGLYLLAISLPFYSNSRSDIVYLTLAVAGFFLVTKRRLRLWPILTAMVVALAMFQLLTTFRTTRDITPTSALTVAAEANPVDSVVLTRNLVSLPHTAHIWRALEDGELELQYGASMTSWLYGWIPRAVWRTKPVVGPGPAIGRAIYGQEIGGSPPGLPAESFWNFGFLGGMLIAPLTGGALGRFDVHLRPGAARDSTSRLTLYLLVVLPLGAHILGNSVTQSILNAAVDVVLMLGGLWLATRLRPPETPRVQRHG